jgi:outer membrane protein OmpA-like peptidoglycan-associated protein
MALILFDTKPWRRKQSKGERNMRTIARGSGIRALQGLVVGLMLLLGQHLAGAAEVTQQEGSPPRTEIQRPPNVSVSPLQRPPNVSVSPLQRPPNITVSPLPPTVQIRETKTEVRLELPGDVLFDFDKWDIRPDAESTLRQVADIIKHHPNAKVTIAGYTDAKGADAYNLRLSEQRAAAVKAWLAQHGEVNGKRITTKGWGEAKPIAPNTHPDGSDNPEGRQKNRRVEVTVKK